MSTRTKPPRRTPKPALPPLPPELRSHPPLKPLPARLITRVPAGHELVDRNGHTWQVVVSHGDTRAFDPMAGTSLALTRLHSTRGPIRLPDPAQVTLW